MPPKRSGVDDPKTMNEFLAMIGGKPLAVVAVVDVPEKEKITGNVSPLIDYVAKHRRRHHHCLSGHIIRKSADQILFR